MWQVGSGSTGSLALRRQKVSVRPHTATVVPQRITLPPDIRRHAPRWIRIQRTVQAPGGRERPELSEGSRRRAGTGDRNHRFTRAFWHVDELVWFEDLCRLGRRQCAVPRQWLPQIGIGVDTGLSEDRRSDEQRDDDWDDSHGAVVLYDAHLKGTETRESRRRQPAKPKQIDWHGPAVQGAGHTNPEPVQSLHASNDCEGRRRGRHGRPAQAAGTGDLCALPDGR